MPVSRRKALALPAALAIGTPKGLAHNGWTKLSDRRPLAHYLFCEASSGAAPLTVSDGERIVRIDIEYSGKLQVIVHDLEPGEVV